MIPRTNVWGFVAIVVAAPLDAMASSGGFASHTPLPQPISFQLDDAQLGEDAAQDPTEDIAGLEGVSPWTFQLAPYMWMAGAKADLTAGPIETSGEASFGDLLKNLDVGAMLRFEARHDRWGIMLDGLYMRLNSDAKVRLANRRIRGLSIDATMEMSILEAAGFYRFGEGPVTVDALAGIRYFSIDVEMDISRRWTILDREVNASQDMEWIDPIVGGRMVWNLADDWLLTLRGDLGGFGIGSELTWNVAAAVGYRLSESTLLVVGYRHLDINYEDNVDFDAQFSGPYLGMSFSF
jgi:hypothetical protein